ncbi:hypothetical protein ACPV4W_05035 [Vibrio diabolicus]|uniref:hypothetical protein n=1 Tax=Vibrio diabolicus TaxID=50719 RepID=UPI00406851F1
MTTTVFKKNKKEACIASDSRVSWVNDQGLPVKWFDPKDYRKTIMIDDVMYGFAGTNVMYKLFLENYTSKEDSNFLLDSLVQLGKERQVQFFIMKYCDGELKLFAYSPPNHQNPEIYRISSDPAIGKDTYAIGSGKFSKEYRKNRTSKNAQLPIRRIITANGVGLKKHGMLDLEVKVAANLLSLDESRQAYFACQKRGGDLFTGGEIKMSKSATRQEIADQIKLLDQMDAESKANGAVCASPINATLEVKELHSIGQYAVSPNKVKRSEDRERLLRSMRQRFDSSV